MTAKPKPQPHDDKAQSRAFIEKAREIEADEKESAADILMGKLAHMPPAPKPSKKPAAKAKKAR